MHYHRRREQQSDVYEGEQRRRQVDANVHSQQTTLDCDHFRRCLIRSHGRIPTNAISASSNDDENSTSCQSGKINLEVHDIKMRMYIQNSRYNSVRIRPSMQINTQHQTDDQRHQSTNTTRYSAAVVAVRKRSVSSVASKVNSRPLRACIRGSAG